MYRCLIALLILSLSCKTSPEIDKDRLNLFFDTIEKHNLANGSIAVSKNGNVIFQREFGFAYKEGQTKTVTNAETRYRIGSVTKMFTAVIALQLVEEKRLQLSDKLSDFIDGIPNADAITIEALLRHQSGLANYSDDPSFAHWKYEPKFREELQQFLLTSNPKFPPGTKSDYSNTNYLLLSWIIEKVCKKSFEEVLNERVIEKIGLKNTYFENVSDSSLRTSKSYKYVNSEWIEERETVASNHLGAGALVSTPVDLLKFKDGLFSNKLLTPQSLTLMTTFVGEYGMGIFKISYNGSDVAFGHEGRIDEFYTSLIHYPNENITIAYCTNGILYPKDDVMKKISDICHNRTITVPNFEEFNVSAQGLSKLIGKYSSSMQISVDCKLENGELIVTTQGQDFVTIQIEENYFANLQYGYFFEFVPEKNQLIIKEADNSYLLNKVVN